MSLPLTLQRFIVKTPDQSQALWSRNIDNVLPFLIAFQDVRGKSIELPVDTSVFKDLPHILNNIYVLYGMSIVPALPKAGVGNQGQRQKTATGTAPVSENRVRNRDRDGVRRPHLSTASVAANRVRDRGGSGGDP